MNDRWQCVAGGSWGHSCTCMTSTNVDTTSSAEQQLQPVPCHNATPHPTRTVRTSQPTNARTCKYWGPSNTVEFAEGPSMRMSSLRAVSTTKMSPPASTAMSWQKQATHSAITPMQNRLSITLNNARGLTAENTKWRLQVEQLLPPGRDSKTFDATNRHNYANQPASPVTPPADRRTHRRHCKSGCGVDRHRRHAVIQALNRRRGGDADRRWRRVTT